MNGDIYFQFNINHCNNVTETNQKIKKERLSLKSIGLGESDGGNVVRLKLICISSKVMGQVHKDLNTNSILKKGKTFK